MRFSEKLARLMAHRDFTQEALAEAMKVSQPSVARWLKDSKPHRSKALQLAEYFGVPIEVLLNDEFDLPEDSTIATFGGYKLTTKVLDGARQAAENASSPAPPTSRSTAGSTESKPS